MWWLRKFKQHVRARINRGLNLRTRRINNRRSGRVPAVEPLESRCLLAVAVGGHCLAEGESEAGAPSLGFITVDGTMLVDSSISRPWFFAGANNYYVGVDELNPQVVDEVMADMKSMGLNVLRLWAFNDDPSKTDTRLQGPHAGDFIEDHFRRLDYAIAKAGENGIRVILALTNYGDGYGGMKQYVTWAGDGSPTADKFFTNEQAQTYYWNFLSFLGNRVNTQTSRAYKDDPTILLWQLANEPRNEADSTVADGNFLTDWIADAAAFLKNYVGVQQLVGIGMEGFYDQGNASQGGSDWMDDEGTDFVSQHALDYIDVAGFHLYPDADHWNTSQEKAVQWIVEHARDSRGEPSLGKPVAMDEFGWSMPLANVADRDEYYREYLAAAYGELINGTNFWRIVDDQRDDTGSGTPMCDLTPDQRVNGGIDSDGLSVCYPGDASTVSVLSQHAQKINLLNVSGIHQLASFERDGEDAFILEGQPFVPGPLERLDQAGDATSIDGVLKVPIAFTAPGQDLSVGVPLQDLLMETRGTNVSDFGYTSLVARLRVDGQFAGPSDAGLLVKMFDRTGSAYKRSDGAEVRVNDSEKWYDLVWRIDKAGDLTDLRTLGVKIHSQRQFTGDLYIELLGGDLFFDWQNTADPLDVNRDGRVTANDALIGINRLNTQDAGPLPFVLPGEASPQAYYDTSGDNLQTPLDVLIVVNHLNDQPPSETGPAIRITELPDDGVGGLIWGRVSGLDDLASYRVATYIQVEGSGWWTKPTFQTPAVPIAADGTFVVDVATGDLDAFATIYCAAVVPAGVIPPKAEGTGQFPADLKSVAMECQERYTRQIEFAGYTWAVKESPLPVGPGDNRFSSETDDVFVDEDGLHLTVKYEDGYWRSSEVILMDHLGYGTYAFQTDSRLDVLDPNVTFGAFLWDAYGDGESAAGAQREIDFEDSRWGSISDPANAQMVIQPYDVDGNLRRYAIPNLAVDSSLTRFFTWQPTRVDFVALRGRHTPSDFAPEDVIDQFVYWENPARQHFVPDQGRESFRFNLWINSDGHPKYGEAVDVVITDFSFTPLPS